MTDRPTRTGDVELARSERRVAAMIEVGRSLTAVHDLDELLRRVAERVTGLLEADRSTIFLVDRARNELWSKVLQGEAMREIRMPLGRGLAGWVIEHGQRVNLRDAYLDPRFNPDVDRASGYRTGSMLCVPFRGKQGEVLGAIQTLNKQGGSFGLEDEALLEALGSQVGIAVENAQLVLGMLAKNLELVEAQEALARKLREQDVLYALEKEIAASLRPEDILARLLRQAVEVVGCEAGSILLSSREDGDLIFTNAVGARAQEVRHLRLPRGAGVAGWVAEHGRPLVVNDPAHEPRHLQELGQKLDFPVASILAVPLSLAGESIGALELLNKRGGPFAAEDEKLATLIAGRAVAAVQVGRQREALEKEGRLASIGQALSGVIHDFRTPMTIISGYVQLMALEDERGKREGYAETVLRQFDFINDMTKELLAFARGESQLLLHKVFTHKLLEEMEELLRRELDSAGVRLNLEDRYGGPLRVDENKLRRLVFNITRNACQAMPQGGEFFVQVEEADGGVQFSFTDTGLGIPEEVQGRLFQSFVTAGKKDGTGLGLALAKRIVDEHDGRIWVEQPEAGGARFVVWLPKRLDGPLAGA
jgi:signal transduction histidine kinase